jgi:N12 class adenine-specific DNA methylase
MQTYTQPDVLAECRLDSFDAWAATFGQTVAAVELAPDGGSYRVTSRLARYRNVPELIAQFRRTADVRVRDDLDLTLLQVKDGRPAVVVVPGSDELARYVWALVARAEAIRGRRVEPDEDNMLKVTNDGRHVALDLRLVGCDPDPDGGKLTVPGIANASLTAQPPGTVSPAAAASGGECVVGTPPGWDLSG